MRICKGILFLFIFIIVCPIGVRAEQEKVATGSQGMVSSAHAVATEAGLRILKKGGNAFDAAVAIAATLNVVEPGNSGMGGYGTILIYDAKKKEIRFLDSSGRIPANLNSDVFRRPYANFRENRRGVKSVSTPGNVNAWWAMSKLYGKLKWAKLFLPAIEAAQKGFTLDNRSARLIEWAFADFPAHSQLFYGRGGQPLKVGQKLVQRDLANTLRMVAALGARVFYNGKIAHAIAAEIKRLAGFLSYQDLANDRAEWWQPIKLKYGDCTVYTASPPSTAFPSLIRLGLMNSFNAAELEHNSTPFLHRFIEASKHAFWCRLKYAGDPEVKPPPLDLLLSSKYCQQQTAGFDLKKARPFVYPGKVGEPAQHTTHFVVADAQGNIVSATQTLGNLFGSRIMPKGTGIWLNNSLAYCTFEPKGNPMDAHAGRRKLSGDCPTIIIKNGRPWAALGTPGGHTIGQTVPQMVMNLIDFKMDIQGAISAARVSFVEPDTIAVEEGIAKKVILNLKAMGHKVRVIRLGLGNAHGLTIKYNKNGEPETFHGAADPRGQGLAKGY